MICDIEIMSLEDIILQRPSLYMGKKSLFGLQCFMQGVWATKRQCKGHPPLFDINPLLMDEWVVKTKVKRKSKKRRSAAEVARLQCNGDEEKAFDLYLQWYKEYKDTLTVIQPDRALAS